MNSSKINPKEIKIDDVIVFSWKDWDSYSSHTFIGKVIEIDIKHYEYKVIGFNGKYVQMKISNATRLVNADEKMEFHRLTAESRKYNKMRTNFLDLIERNN